MDKNLLWKNILEEIKLTVSGAIFQTMFQHTTLISINNNVANIGCLSSYIKNYIESRYYSLIKEICDRQTKQNNSLIFTIYSIANKKIEDHGPLFNSDRKPENSEIIKKITNSCGLKSDYIFENFAVSSSNQLPFAAATAVAKNPGNAYNPLFLWGGVGVGKTHLMHAIGNEIINRNRSVKIICSPGEEFTNEIVNAIRSRTTDQFKKKYRSANLLLLDDVQFIAGKDTVQEEFFHTFNAIQREGGQVVLTSDRPPSEIAKLEERLRSRFEAGLIVDIPAPDFELRTAILLIKAKQKNIDLSMEIAQLIASNIDQNRTIEGFVTMLTTQAAMRNVPISIEMVNSLLGKVNKDAQTKVKIIKPTEVIEAVASYFNLKTSQLKGQTRVREIVVPRQILMYLLRVELGIQFEEVGKIIGGRDHSTIIHGVDKITNLIETNEDIRVDISGIKQKIC